MSTNFASPRLSLGRRTVSAVILALVGVLTVTLFAAEADARKRKKPHSVSVMTRNLYLGSVLDDAAEEARREVRFLGRHHAAARRGRGER